MQPDGTSACTNIEKGDGLLLYGFARIRATCLTGAVRKAGLSAWGAEARSAARLERERTPRLATEQSPPSFSGFSRRGRTVSLEVSCILPRCPVTGAHHLQ